MSAPQYGERAEPGPEDVCYRHPDRPSFTLCQRCGRTVCPDCYTNSAVGVLCADCVRAAQPGTAQVFGRQSRVFVRRLSDTATPVVTYGIMIACAVVYAAQWLASVFLGDAVTQLLWYAPLHSMPQFFEPWRMVTSIFTHSTGFLLHILFNMYSLWLFGPGLERMLGRLWFFALYLLSGFGGSLGVMLWVYLAPDPRVAMLTATVGASGAIFGLLGATAVALKASRVNVTSLLVLIGINLAIGFMPGSGISWQAHLGGMIVGALTMWALIRTAGPRLKSGRWMVIGALTGALVLLSFAFFIAAPLTVT